jgi:hypothetical protein
VLRRVRGRGRIGGMSVGRTREESGEGEGGISVHKGVLQRYVRHYDFLHEYSV